MNSHAEWSVAMSIRVRPVQLIHVADSVETVELVVTQRRIRQRRQNCPLYIGTSQSSPTSK